ncbi:MAG TPA: hypothetical protein PLO27_03845, partial [Marmoricola sp.]|nr:hypothetical protein [Marmoricola sp.]
FGTTGGTTMTLEQGSAANAMVVQADDRVVSAGWVQQGSARRFLVTRHTTSKDLSGWVDYSFGGGPGRGNKDGASWIPVGSGNDAEANAVQMTPNQLIVAAGRASNGSNNDFALVRIKANGEVDPTFGSANGVVTDFGGTDDVVRALAVQPDWKYVVAGTSNGRVALARYLPNGSLDPTFGAGGKVITTVSSTDEARGIVLQPDGRILVAGSTSMGGVRNTMLLRYLANGSPDASFGAGGRVVASFSPNNDAASSVALQPDGRILVAGYSDGAARRGFLVARFHASGAVDASFGFAGSVLTTFARSAEATSMAVQPDGKIVLVGTIQKTGGGTDLAMARYHNDQPLAHITTPGRRIKRKNFHLLAGSVSGANVTHARFAIQKLNPRLQRRGTCQWMMPAGFVLRTKAYANKKRRMVCEPKTWYDVRSWSVSRGVGYWSVPIRGFKPGTYVISVRGIANKVNQETPTKKRVRVVR